MRALPRAARRPRRGTTVVEASLVISVFLLFLFGVFEYSRYLFFLHVAQNAARDGARYAAVSVSQPANFDYADAVAGGVTYPSVWRHTVGQMAGVDRMVAGFTVSTFPCDSSQLYTDPPVIAPKPGYVAPTPADYAAPGSPSAALAGRTCSWNQAGFSERIACRISGAYNPLLPNFLFMGNTVAVSVTSVMGSEG